MLKLVHKKALKVMLDVNVSFDCRDLQIVVAAWWLPRTRIAQSVVCWARCPE